MIFLFFLFGVCRCRSGGTSGGHQNLPFKLSSPHEIFSPSPAQKTLIKWATDVVSNGGSLSHGEANRREKHVVEMVESGIWPPEVYTEYQMFSSRSGNVDSVRLLLEYGVQTGVELIQKEKNHFAKKFARSLLSCNISMIRSALNKSPGCENFVFVDGNTPLILAAFANCTKGVKVLLEEGADSSQRGSHGLSPYLLASSLGHVEVVETLLSVNPDDVFHRHQFANTSALHMAAEMGHTRMILRLCELGINATETRTLLDGTALHTAAQVGKWESVIPLLHAPCSIPIDSLMGGDTTSLYLSAQYGHFRTVQILLRHGAAAALAMPVAKFAGVKGGVVGLNGNTRLINSEPSNGATAIHVAAENGHVKVVKALLRVVSPDLMADIGVAPLHLAVQYSRLPVVQVLISNHASIDIISQVDGCTPLYYAVGMQNFEIIKILLEAKASPLVRRELTNITPLSYSLTLPNVNIVEILFRAIPQCRCMDRTLIVECHMDDLSLWEAVLLSGNSVKTKLKLLHLLFQYFAECDLSSLRDSDLQSILHLAVTTGRAVFVKKIMSYLDETKPGSAGALSDRYSLHGLTPLHSLFLANDSQRIDYRVIIQLLLGAGGSVDSVLGGSDSVSDESDHSQYNELRGATPLYLACSTTRPGMEEVVEVLLNHGADPNIHLTSNNFTPLLAAIDRSTVEVVRLLLFGPTNPNSSILKLADPNLTGGAEATAAQSPLLFAVIRGRVDIVALLLHAGADCHTTILVQQKTSNTVESLTFVEIARRRRDYDMLQLLSTSAHCNNNNHSNEL